MTALFSPGLARRRVGVGLTLVTVVAWAYLILLSVRMGDMHSPLAMPMTSTWTRQDVVLMGTMWAVMMAGTMLPSAAPMISAYAATAGSNATGLRGSTPSFVAGYLAVWAGFGAVATAAQWVLHDLALVDVMGSSTSDRLGGALLIGAGAYQFTGLKNTCLRQCRSPLAFLLNEWRDGRRGAIVMGVRHGAFCVGCCWALMALVFVLGVVNLWWIALITAVVLVEKVIPVHVFTRLLGVGLLAWGAGLATGVGVLA